MCINKLLGESLRFLTENQINITLVFYVCKGFICLGGEKEIASLGLFEKILNGGISVNI
jgi:hypothetical protein